MEAINIPFSPSRLDATYFISKMAKNLLKKDQTIIDIGSGGYYLVSLLSLLNVELEYLGIDINPKKFDETTFKIKAHIVKKDFLHFNTSKKFDVATCLWTLEHIQNDEKALEKISRLLTKTGILIIAVPSIWSWPIEFGRHGFRYYTKKNLIKKVTQSGFKILKLYEAGGFLGLIFMLVYSWPRYIFLIPLYLIYHLMVLFRVTNKSWSDYSKNFVSNTFYTYHTSKRGVKIHNKIVKAIVDIDNKLKFMPASYVLVLKK